MAKLKTKTTTASAFATAVAVSKTTWARLDIYGTTCDKIKKVELKSSVQSYTYEFNHNKIHDRSSLASRADRAIVWIRRTGSYSTGGDTDNITFTITDTGGTQSDVQTNIVLNDDAPP